MISLASFGTVDWRCDPAHEPSLALGFRAFADSADSYLRLQVGRRTIEQAHVVPAQSVLLPFFAATRQQLDITQGTEAGTLRAYVAVDFAASASESHCWAYSPPQVTARLLPRR